MERGVKKPNPYVDFLVDLKKWLKPRITSGEEVLLFIDANEEWGQRSKITNFCEELGLNNLAHRFLEEECHTRPFTKKTIDFAIGTDNLMDCVESFSMVPYNLEVLGDHRGIMVDVNLRKLLGYTKLDNMLINQRRLNSKDKDAVEAYLEKVEKNFQHHRVFDRLDALVESFKNYKHFFNQNVEAYEKLHTDIHRLCRNAEKGCKKLSNHNTYWSPKLRKAVDTLRYWNKILEKHTKGITVNENIIGWKKTLGVGETPKSTKDIKTKVKEAKIALDAVIEDSQDIRVEFLKKMAEKYASENMCTEEHAIRELLLHEEDREIWRVIKFRLKENERTQLDKIWIDSKRGSKTNKKDNKIEIDDTAEMHKKLLGRNKKHLRQARVTPFAEGTMSSVLGQDGDSEACEAILEGDWIPPEGTQPWLREYVKNLKVDDNIQREEIITDITSSEYTKFWKKKRENTSTSPLGLHVGHYKVSILNEDIAEVHRIMMVLPFMYGFSPKRWCSSVQLMLQKDPGHPWIHRLRIIELLDASLNAALMILIGRKMIHYINDKNIIHQSAYGSVPGRTAQGALAQKILTIDMLRYNRECGGIFECDATGCFDRILPNLQTLHTRRIGLQKNAAIAMATILRNMKRFIGTKFGMSNKYIKTGLAFTLYGIGQGSGGGPAVWLCHLIVLFAILETTCSIPKFTSPNREKVHSSGGTGYVDDCTLMVQIKGKCRDAKKIIKKLTHNAQTWERSLHSTGGKLELPKCFWCMVMWRWVGGLPKLTTCKQAPTHLKIIQTETRKKKTVTIKRIETTDFERVLGVRMDIAGTWKGEIAEWIGKSLKFASKVRTAKFPRQCGIRVYQFIWVPKIRYVSSIVCFTKEQCQKIQSPVIKACLSASGLSAQFPRAVVFGPQLLGGLGWEKGRSIQTFEFINLFLNHVKQNDSTGKLMLINLETAQLHSGLSTPILQQKKHKKHTSNPPGFIVYTHYWLKTSYKLRYKITGCLLHREPETSF